jgi:hypothetical protein
MLQGLGIVPGRQDSLLSSACTLCDAPQGFAKFQALLSHTRNIHKGTSEFPKDTRNGRCACNMLIMGPREADGDNPENPLSAAIQKSLVTANQHQSGVTSPLMTSEHLALAVKASMLLPALL